MEPRFCKLCKSKKCHVGVELEIPGSPDRKIHICKSCILREDNPLVTYNIKIGVIDIAAIKANLSVPCPYKCATRPPLGCAAPQPPRFDPEGCPAKFWPELKPFGKRIAGGVRGTELCVFASGPTGKSLLQGVDQRGSE